MTAGAFLDGLAGGYFSGSKIKEAKAERAQRKAEREAAPAPQERGLPVPSSGGASTPFVYDGAISDRVSHAYNRFIDAGLPPHVAAGLTGNLMQESGAQINPAAVGDNGNAFGSGQWNGPRMKAYRAFANERGASPTDFDTQLDFLLHEGATSEKSAWDAIMATGSADEAARVASAKFWRPGVPHLERRAGYAGAVYDRFNQQPTQGVDLSSSPAMRERGVLSGLSADVLINRFYKKGA